MKLNPSLFLALLFLTNCSQSPVAEDNGTAAGPALPMSLADQYPALKTAALESIRAELADAGEPTYLLQEIEGDKFFDVMDCAESERNPEVRAPAGRAGSVETLARRIAFLELNFAAAGYRREVYKAPLAAYEDWSLAAIVQGEEPLGNGDAPGLSGPAHEQAQLRFATQVEANRSKLQPTLPRVVVEGGCGAGGTSYLIKTQPAGGRVWLVTRFGFNACRAMGLEPWDREKCNRWYEADPDQPMSLSGTYVYQASWRNGARGRGEKRLESTEADPEKMPVVTIRPS
jgi:hypothetical protein